MNIKPITAGNNQQCSPSFGANVNIVAKSTLLDEASIKELKEIGQKIGDKNVNIDMFVGYKKDNPYVYNYAHKTELNLEEKFKSEKLTFETNEDIVTPTITPLDYGKKLLGRIKEFVAINTVMS